MHLKFLSFAIASCIWVISGSAIAIPAHQSVQSLPFVEATSPYVSYGILFNTVLCAILAIPLLTHQAFANKGLRSCLILALFPAIHIVISVVVGMTVGWSEPLVLAVAIAFLWICLVKLKF